MRLHEVIAYFNVIAILYLHGSSAKRTLPIGVIFHQEPKTGMVDVGLTDAYRYECRKVNDGHPRGMLFDHNPINYTNTYDSFHLMSAMCQRMSVGVVALIIDSRPSSYDAMVSLANTKQIPLLLPFGTESFPGDPYEYDFSLFPSYILAIADIVVFNRWKTVYYLYDINEPSWRLQQLFRASEGGEPRPKFIIRVRPIQNISNSYELLRSIDRLDQKEPKRIIIDLSSTEAYQSILDQIVDVGMNRDGYHYVLGTLGIDELKIDTFIHGGVNITGFSILDKKGNVLLKNFENEIKNTKELMPITYRKALLIDTVRVLENALTNRILKDLKIWRKSFFYNGDEKGIPCHGSPWDKGPDMRRAMKNVSLEGLTGTIEFDRHGLRENYTLYVHQLEYKRKLRQVATWKKNQQPRFKSLIGRPKLPFDAPIITNKTLIITTILDEPFCQLADWKGNGADDGSPFLDGKHYEGYAVDLAELVATSDQIKFNYKIRTVTDKQYGSLNLSTGEWNGMMGELIRGKADMAIAPLTINEIRERAVEFTKPFMKTGISIMIKKPDKEKPGVFSFMAPLSKTVWMCITIAFFAVSLVLFVVGRWSPYEWHNNNGIKGEIPTNTFTLNNTLWFALGALMQQGSDIFPRSYSGRIVGSAWWFFTLILISSYTANLAAFLTVENLFPPIRSAEELSKQTDIEYGTLNGGSTDSFFEKQKEGGLTVYRKMWEFMTKNEANVMVANNREGVHKVRKGKGKYAFLLESPTNEYNNQRMPCNTMKVGENLDSKGYGIATPLNSVYSTSLNIAVLQLREHGELHKLQQRWWYAKGQCGSSDGQNPRSPLTLSNVSGIFHILIGGLILAIIVAWFEYMAHRQTKSRNNKNNTRTPPQIVKRHDLESLSRRGFVESDNAGYSYTPTTGQLVTFSEPIPKSNQTDI